MASDSRVWLVTGSSQGLGRALVEAILAAGEKVVATARNTASLQPLTSQYPSNQLLVAELDVTNQKHIECAFEATKEHFGRLDVIVNNAGYGLSSEIETAPDEEARKQIEVLFWGPVNICKKAIPFFRDVNPPGVGGHILNIASIGGYQGGASLAFYSAGKFALEGFTESLAREMLPEWNIKATIVEPGGFQTAWARSSLVELPSLPVYKQEHAPSEQMRRVRNPDMFIGDPAKAAQALLKIAGRKDLPIRIQLGTDSVFMVRSKAQRTLNDTLNPEWEALAHSTNRDGVDKDKVLEMFKAAVIE
ncbi:NAD(P)-binding protein [Panus rudis PR-1116 ss-1]|nr:NAD(P)-binding protein [Panus rudis PR-1116 ss-1]